LFGDYSGGGLAVNGQVGVMFMRTSSARIYAEVRVDQNLIPLSPSNDYYDYCYSGSSSCVEPDRPDDIFPTEVSFAVGIGW
jgi:hypothetical protein